MVRLSKSTKNVSKSANSIGAGILGMAFCVFFPTFADTYLSIVKHKTTLVDNLTN